LQIEIEPARVIFLQVPVKSYITEAKERMTNYLLTCVNALQA